MVFRSWQKLAAVTLNSLGTRRSVDNVMEAFAFTSLRDDRLVPAASTIDGMKSGAPALSPEVCNKIGRQLQEIYDFVLHEPLPDRFSELLNGLEYARD